MAEAVLDASCAWWHSCEMSREPKGCRRAYAVVYLGVNLAETISKMVEHGKPLDEVSYQIERPADRGHSL